jgi:hypothetical protein
LNRIIDERDFYFRTQSTQKGMFSNPEITSLLIYSRVKHKSTLFSNSKSSESLEGWTLRFGLDDEELRIEMYYRGNPKGHSAKFNDSYALLGCRKENYDNFVEKKRFMRSNLVDNSGTIWYDIDNNQALKSAGKH